MPATQGSKQAIDVLISGEYGFAYVRRFATGKNAMNLVKHPLSGGQHFVEFAKRPIKGVAAAKCCQKGSEHDDNSRFESVVNEDFGDDQADRG